MSLRVVMLTQWYDPEGGAAAGPGTIARALRDRGHEVHVVTGFPNYPSGRVFAGYRVRPYTREVRDGVTVHRSAIYPSHDTGALRRAATYLSFALSGTANALMRVPRPDVVLVYSSPATTAIPGMALRAVKHVPFVIQIQDMWPQSVTSSGFITGGRVGRVERVLQRYCDTVYGRASTVAVTSPGMRSLVERRGVPAAKIVLVPNWADESSFAPAQVTDALVAEFGPFRPFTAMYAGNFGELQGLDTVIDAADRLSADPTIGFVLVGAGVAEERLRARVRELQLDNVRFVPAQPFSRMAEILALGDVQIISLKDVPLLRWTLPSKVQATMAAGRPIIGCVAGDAASVIEEARAGFVCPPQDATALADAVRKMADESRDTREAFGASARQYYRDHFSERVVGDELSDILTRAGRATVGP